jgi:hypothetical protein
MNVIINSAGMQRPKLVLTSDPAYVRQQPQLKFRNDDSPTFLCTKNTMQELANVGVCHIVFSVVPDGTPSLFSMLPTD